MFAQVPLFPEQASTIAGRVDGLFFFLIAVTGSVSVLVTVLIIFFAIKYRRRSAADRTPRILGSFRLEMFWTITPLFFFFVMFYWGASIYNEVSRPPDDAPEVYVVGKQWMWKIQHPDGQREINELHLPVGRPVKLILTSEDVIHDFFVPAFRTKVDVIPGRYVTTWFHPTRVGTYHLFCAQYCGTNHSGMVGSVVVMERQDYDDWLESTRAEGSLALQGRKLFLKLQCDTCHSPGSHQRAPLLENLYGSTVHLEDGSTVTAGDAYIRESILYPEAKVVQGWRSIMPTFKGQLEDKGSDLTEEEALIQLVAFIRTLGPGQTPVRTEDFPAPVGAPTRPKEKEPASMVVPTRPPRRE
ncbi:MAG TPA: cytochrome c oxidase subunit II [Gemmataceae bacterium]|jgi:cytochrome c oxidase subunit 2|nr:cytochrome c oxidase subunit II [Gemmataceae bacterium]